MELAKTEGALFCPALKNLSCHELIAKLLSNPYWSSGGHEFILECDHVTPEIAEELIGSPCDLRLITPELSSDVAEILGRFKRHLTLMTDAPLSESQVCALADQPTGLTLSLVEFCDNSANALGHLKRLAFVETNEQIELEVSHAELLSAGVKDLTIPKNFSISLAALRKLSAIPSLGLDNLREISQEQAELIAAHRGRVSLRNLNHVPDNVLMALAAFNGTELDLPGLRIVSTRTYRELTANRAIQIRCVIKSVRG